MFVFGLRIALNCVVKYSLILDIALSLSFSSSGVRSRPACVSDGAMPGEDPSPAGSVCSRYFSLLLRIIAASKNDSLMLDDRMLWAKVGEMLDLSINLCSRSSTSRLFFSFMLIVRESSKDPKYRSHVKFNSFAPHYFSYLVDF